MLRVGSFIRLFAMGMFMMFERDALWALNEFNERAPSVEDYLLSQRVPRLRFRKTMIHSWDDGYFSWTMVIGPKHEQSD
jgi:hypothetical protein